MPARVATSISCAAVSPRSYAKYAAGDEFSIADLSLYAGYWRTRGAFPELLAGTSSLERWGNEMAARPAIQRAVKL